MSEFQVHYRGEYGDYRHDDYDLHDRVQRPMDDLVEALAQRGIADVNFTIHKFHGAVTFWYEMNGEWDVINDPEITALAKRVYAAANPSTPPPSERGREAYPTPPESRRPRNTRRSRMRGRVSSASDSDDGGIQHRPMRRMSSGSSDEWVHLPSRSDRNDEMRRDTHTLGPRHVEQDLRMQMAQMEEHYQQETARLGGDNTALREELAAAKRLHEADISEVVRFAQDACQNPSINDVRGAIQEIDQYLSTLRRRLLRLDDAQFNNEEQIASLTRERDLAISAKTRLLGEISRLEGQFGLEKSDLRRQITEYEEQIEELAQQLRAAPGPSKPAPSPAGRSKRTDSVEVERLKRELEDAKRDLVGARRTAQAHADEVDRLRREGSGAPADPGQMQQLTDEINRLSAEKTALERQLSEKTPFIADLQRRLGEATHANEQIKQKSEATIEELQARLVHVEQDQGKENRELKREIAKVREDAKKATATKDQEIAQLRGELVQAQKSEREAQETVRRLESKLERVNGIYTGQLEKLSGEVERLKGVLSEKDARHSAQIADLQRQNDVLKAARDRLQQYLDAANEARERSEERSLKLAEAMEGRVLLKPEELEELRDEIKSADRMAADAQKEADARQEEIVALQSQLDEMGERVVDLLDEREQMQDVHRLLDEGQTATIEALQDVIRQKEETSNRLQQELEVLRRETRKTHRKESKKIGALTSQLELAHKELHQARAQFARLEKNALAADEFHQKALAGIERRHEEREAALLQRIEELAVAYEDASYDIHDHASYLSEIVDQIYDMFGDRYTHDEIFARLPEMIERMQHSLRNAEREASMLHEFDQAMRHDDEMMALQEKSEKQTEALTATQAKLRSAETKLWSAQRTINELKDRIRDQEFDIRLARGNADIARAELDVSEARLKRLTDL